jgi:dienelactone hydrolase
MPRRVGQAVLVVLAMLLGFPADVRAQPAIELLSFAREHRGAPIQVGGTLLLPPGTGKVPVMVVHHGSGGVSETREYRYAREMVALGVGAFVLDSFKPRGITSTVSDQAAVSALEMTLDAFGALQALAKHPRVEATKIGIVGFSKGGTVVLRTARKRQAAAAKVPPGQRFALHVAFYPACGDHFHNVETTGAPILMLLGAADTYAGVAPCTEWAEKLKAGGAKVEVKIYPGARHGFDGGSAYTVATGENWSGCVFTEQPDGTWRERKSAIQFIDARGKRDDTAFQKALAGCRTRGVSGGPDPAAAKESMTDFKTAVSRHLLGR